MPQTALPPFRVPHVTHALANGMRVIAHEDHTSPVVAVHLMYHVGSKDERPGRTGLAHLLEHLLFEGSLHCPKGEFDRLLEQAGGTNNGSTWLDRTNYYEVVPSHAVELALWLERERMGFFLPVLDEEMLEVQRGVVINERKQAYENRPYGMADERLNQLLFGEAHPYSWPTIGYVSDLQSITLEDAQIFFSNFYTPRNAVLVFAGDITPDDAFRLAEGYFGDLPGGPSLPVRESPASPPVAPDPAELFDRVTFPRLYQAQAVPAYGTREWVTLDVLTYLVSDGESSHLQRALVRELQIAQDVDAFLYPTEICGVFGITATARSGVTADDLQIAVDEVMERVADGEFTEDDLTGAIRRARRDHLGALSNVEERAEELAYAATVLGAPAALDDLLDTYPTVTAEEIRECAGRHITDNPAARLSVVPAARGAGAHR